MKTGEEIQKKFGVPIVNKRISVTPGVYLFRRLRSRGFSGYCPDSGQSGGPGSASILSAVFPHFVQKGMTCTDEALIESIPEALGNTQNVCGSVNVGSSRSGINMDAVRILGERILDLAYVTKA